MQGIVRRAFVSLRWPLLPNFLPSIQGQDRLKYMVSHCVAVNWYWDPKDKNRFSQYLAYSSTIIIEILNKGDGYLLVELLFIKHWMPPWHSLVNLWKVLINITYIPQKPVEICHWQHKQPLSAINSSPLKQIPRRSTTDILFVPDL